MGVEPHWPPVGTPLFSAEGAVLSQGQSRRQNCIISVVIWKRKQGGGALKVENGYAFQLIVPKIIKICYCIWQLYRALQIRLQIVCWTRAYNIIVDTWRIQRGSDGYVYNYSWKHRKDLWLEICSSLMLTEMWSTAPRRVRCVSQKNVHTFFYQISCLKNQWRMSVGCSFTPDVYHIYGILLTLWQAVID